MANQVFETLTAPDSVVVRTFREIAAQLEITDATVSAQPMNGISAMSDRLDKIEASEAFQEVLSLGVASFLSLSVQLPSLNAHVSVTRQKEGIDLVTISIQDGTQPATAIRITSRVRLAFHPYDRSAT